MKNEYYIKKLWFTGPGIEDSPVEFINGLNIIHGANDTGKSSLQYHKNSSQAVTSQ